MRYFVKCIIPNFQHGSTAPKGISTTRKIRKKMRMRPQGWHGRHPEHDPEKRWAREKLNHVAALSVKRTRRVTGDIKIDLAALSEEEERQAAIEWLREHQEELGDLFDDE